MTAGKQSTATGKSLLLTAWLAVRHQLSSQLPRSEWRLFAIHACDLPLPQKAPQAGMALSLLGEFFTGERTLRSDVMDRLAAAVGLVTAQSTGADSQR